MSINMGEPNGNNLPDLRRAMRVMRGEVQRIEKITRVRSKLNYAKLPRRYCSVCGKTFDEAIIDPKTNIQASLCVTCDQTLKKGYTAVITSDSFAFIKSDYFKEHGMAGKIVPVNEAVFKKVQGRYESDKTETPPA